MSNFSGGPFPPNRSRSPHVFGASPSGPDPAPKSAFFSPFASPDPSRPAFKPPTTPASSLPADVAALHTIINSLQAELRASASVNTHLAASVARQLQAEQLQAPLTPASTDATTTPTTAATSLPQRPCTIASGRGAASPEIFQRIIKTNWHGRLGRTHMVDVDSLSATALSELDSLVRRKLGAIYPPGRKKVDSAVDADTIFASLAALGLRLENRGAYLDVPCVDGDRLCDAPTLKRVRNSVAWRITHENYADFWHGFALETLVELGRYRGLFDDEGFLIKEE